MPPKSTWRDRRYPCAQRGFPAFARMRLIYEALRASKKISKKNEFYHQIGIPLEAGSTWKNILDGRVLDSPHAEVGWSRFDSEMITSAVAALQRHGYAIRLADLEDRMTEADFVERLNVIIPSKDKRPVAAPPRDDDGPNESDEVQVKFGSLPHILPRLTPWNETGRVQIQQINAWIAGTEPYSRHLGVAGPSGCGKTALVSTCLKNAGLADTTLWLDCNQFGTFELMIERFIGAILTAKEESEQGVRKMEVVRKVDWILHRLGEMPPILVLDAIDSLFEHPGELAESMRDTLMEAFLHRIAEETRCRIIYLAENSRNTGPNIDVRWMPITTTLYDPRDIVQTARDSNERDHLPRGGQGTAVPENDAFPAEQVFEDMLRTLDASQIELLVFITLIGEEVRKSTILQYVDTYLSVHHDQQAFLDHFWQQCHTAGAKVVQIILRVYDDKIDHPTSPENLLHYKFHDSIILTAQRYFTENSARYSGSSAILQARRSSRSSFVCTTTRLIIRPHRKTCCTTSSTTVSSSPRSAISPRIRHATKSMRCIGASQDGHAI
jgi:SpoVK/Ycf46/Vps4 family AAA+-type ATPase